MPNVKSAIKRVKKSQAERVRNRRERSRLRTAVKKVRAAQGPEAESDLQVAASLLDRAARKGLIHPNKAARDKSRLSRHVKAGSAAGK
ncbi:MAG: 30S ribosomal protein S20 [Gemmatimonadota bacterium]